MTTAGLMAAIGAISLFARVGAYGEPVDVWDNGAVIYAEVIAVENVRPTLYKVDLKPLATLTGSLDPAFLGIVTADVIAGYRETSEFANLPSKGAKVIVFIEKVDGTWRRVPNGSNDFLAGIDRKGAFPPAKHYPCLFEVTGFDDPKVTETIENLRKLRGKQREEAKKAPAGKKPATLSAPAAK